MTTITYGIIIGREDIKRIPDENKYSPALRLIPADEYVVVALKRLSRDMNGELCLFEGLPSPIAGEENILQNIHRRIDASTSPSYILINIKEEDDEGTEPGTATPADGDNADAVPAGEGSVRRDQGGLPAKATVAEVDIEAIST